MAKERVSSDIDRKLRIEARREGYRYSVSQEPSSSRSPSRARSNTFNVHKENKRLTAERNRFKAQAEEAETNFNVCSDESHAPTDAQLVGTPLEYLALDRITRLCHFRYTHTRYNRENELISHDTGPISGNTAKSVKFALVKKFHLQAWDSWTCLPNGTYKRSHNCNQYRGIITIEPIPEL